MGIKQIPVGTRFGRLVVLSTTGVTYTCKCDCGRIVCTNGRRLRSGCKQSCSCLRTDTLRLRSVKPIETGTIFGRLTVTAWNGRTCKCRCECGEELSVRSTNLRTGKTKSCGCFQKDRARGASIVPISPGAKFGKLVVIGHIGNNLYKCRCECGNEVDAASRNLKRGHKKSCGCLLVEQAQIMSQAKMLMPGEAAFGSLLSFYANQARKRNFSFTLTKNEFRELTSSPCAYCGSLPSSVKYTNTGKYVYNGIDRVDSTKGYGVENCCAACWFCNNAKHTLTTTQFIEWITRVKTRLDSQVACSPNSRELVSNSVVRMLLRRYKSTALLKKHEFALTEDQFMLLISGTCSYCGIEPEREAKYYKHTVLYNGIDRVDNKFGYVPGNVVTCCFTCNNAKSILSAEDFSQHVRKVFEHISS
jgi:hypothetical protein